MKHNQRPIDGPYWDPEKRPKPSSRLQKPNHSPKLIYSIKIGNFLSPRSPQRRRRRRGCSRPYSGDQTMAMELERATKKRRGGIDDLPDDLIVEILSRLPAKSVCRFKCVSWRWRRLISHRDHRKKLPHTLSGFISRYCGPLNDDELVSIPHFDSIDGGEEDEEEHRLVPDPSLSFLLGYMSISPKDCCNGLLLCLCCKNSPRDESDYVVCNTATQRWIILPEIDDYDQLATIRLCFDPALSPYFHVFAILEDADGRITGVEIFSSETGRWSHRENGWVDQDDHMVRPDAKSVFVDGMVNFISFRSAIIAVDMEGKKWKTIPFLEQMNCQCFCSGNLAFIGQSQGHLYYINSRNRDSSILSVWTLDDYCSRQWSFKYNISTSQLFGWTNMRLEREYNLIAIHPDCNMIFYVSRDEGQNTLPSYDMDRGEINSICNIRDPFWNPWDPCLPYVPVFMENRIPPQKSSSFLPKRLGRNLSLGAIKISEHGPAERVKEECKEGHGNINNAGAGEGEDAAGEEAAPPKEAAEPDLAMLSAKMDAFLAGREADAPTSFSEVTLDKFASAIDCCACTTCFLQPPSSRPLLNLSSFLSSSFLLSR
uniref:F-box domain-containing protein n=1 Tax=Oryza glumipatula TaxID=40148 RepID=A0A0D9ZTY9_9ORYZ